MLRNGMGKGEGFKSSTPLLVTDIVLLGSAMGRYIHVVNSECLWYADLAQFIFRPFLPAAPLSVVMMLNSLRAGFLDLGLP